MPLTARWWDGFAFFPASGTIALSDHRLGESLLATPLQWAGTSAVTVHNLTLLATFLLCALAAYWLGSSVPGVTTPHSSRARLRLQPVPDGASRAPRAARRVRHARRPRGVSPYERTRRVVWLAAFSAALTVQTLCATYYALFFAIVLAMWMVWFLRGTIGARRS